MQESDCKDGENSRKVDDVPDSRNKQRTAPENKLLNSSYSDSDDDDDDENDDEENDDVMDSIHVLSKPKPKHSWFAMKEIINREYGTKARLRGNDLFQMKYSGSLHAVQRLELMYKLEAHHGCVNALHFNQKGTKLASGSDDMNIVIWDWAPGNKLTQYESGHKSNVFQIKFLPFQGDTHLVSCGRDGCIRLAEMSSTGVRYPTRNLAKHHGAAHRLCVQPAVPHEVLTSGEDGVVMNIDVRTTKPVLLVEVHDRKEKIGLYGIHSNPVNHNEFLVCGRDSAIRLYDKRIDRSDPVKKFCPKHLKGSKNTSHVTCAIFNFDGTEVLGSYNDEDIYLFDKNSNGEEYVHKYEGHRNSATIKGINFFGQRSEFVVSGSDCGYIYFWDKRTESIIQWLAADEDGIVNCLENHPQFPVIATSGLDHDVKIWVPSRETERPMTGLEHTLRSNKNPESIVDEDLLWIVCRDMMSGMGNDAILRRFSEARKLFSRRSGRGA